MMRLPLQLLPWQAHLNLSLFKQILTAKGFEQQRMLLVVDQIAHNKASSSQSFETLRDAADVIATSY